MMMSTLERPHAPRMASAEPELLGLLALLALGGALVTFAPWPAVFAAGIAAYAAQPAGGRPLFVIGPCCQWIAAYHRYLF